MGDHIIGRAMGRAADAWWAARGERPPPGREEALAVLEAICGPYRGRDAEFEAEDPKWRGRVHPDYDFYTDPNGPLGRLIAIGFDATPEEIDLGDEDTAPWFEGPKSRFSDHFDFC